MEDTENLNSSETTEEVIETADNPTNTAEGEVSSSEQPVMVPEALTSANNISSKVKLAIIGSVGLGFFLCCAGAIGGFLLDKKQPNIESNSDKNLNGTKDKTTAKPTPSKVSSTYAKWHVSTANKKMHQARLIKVIKYDPALKFSDPRFDSDQVLTRPQMTDEQKKFINFKDSEFYNKKEKKVEVERMAIAKNSINVYLEFSKKFYELTGKIPNLTSACRRSTITSESSYHKNCMAVDISVARVFNPKTNKYEGLRRSDLNKMYVILTELSLEGKLAVRRENNPPHIHVVLVPKDQQERFKKYVQGGRSRRLDSSQKTTQLQYKLKNPGKHCSVSYKPETQGHTQCTEMLRKLEISKSVRVPNIRGDVNEKRLPKFER